MIHTCIPNRLTLTGPSSEVDRFLRLCIVQHDGDAPTSFPFGQLVPEPDVIKTLFATGTEQAKHAAFAATGFDSWTAWRVAHYGTIVPLAMEPVVVQHSSDNVEILFETANSCPLPFLSTLAREFPRLRGTIIAAHRWERTALVGLIADGQLAGFSGEYTVPYFYLLREARYTPWLTKGLIQALERRLAYRSESADGTSGVSIRDVCTADLWRDVCAELPEDYALRLNLFLDADRLLAWHGEEDLAFNYFEKGARPPLEQLFQSPENIGLLQGQGRAWSALDRRLTWGIAAMFFDDMQACMAGGRVDVVSAGATDLRITRFARMLLAGIDEGGLYDWAAHAMFRPGVHVDFSSRRTLRKGFVDYALQLHRAMTHHLDRDVDGGSATSLSESPPLPASAIEQAEPRAATGLR